MNYENYKDKPYIFSKINTKLNVKVGKIKKGVSQNMKLLNTKILIDLCEPVSLFFIEELLGNR